MTRATILALLWCAALASAVQWDGNWAFGCDFPGNELLSIHISKENCSSLCSVTAGCTHFSWSDPSLQLAIAKESQGIPLQSAAPPRAVDVDSRITIEEGLCVLKVGAVSKEQAVKKPCGVWCFCGINSSPKREFGPITWSDAHADWTAGCLFGGGKLSTAKWITREGCRSLCQQTTNCTHFDWLALDGGYCRLMAGLVSKKNALMMEVEAAACGILGSRKAGRMDPVGKSMGPVIGRVNASVVNGALGTCELPAGAYTVPYAAGLGDDDNLGYLKFQPELCGQVLRVDCGNGQLHVVVAGVTVGSQLALSKSAWGLLTGSRTANQTQCQIQLMDRNPLQSGKTTCHHNPGSPQHNKFFRNVGLLNTNGRKVVGMEMNERLGRHRGYNPYYAVNGGSWDDDTEVLFFLDDGSSQRMTLADCEKETEKQKWM